MENIQPAMRSAREIRFAPVEDRYVQPSPVERLFAPLVFRLAWIASGGLSLVAAILLVIKLCGNIVDSFFHSSSIQVARKNFVSAGIIPFLGIGLAIVSVLPYSTAGIKWVRRKVFPAPEIYANYVATHPAFDLPATSYLRSVELPSGMIIDSIDLPFSALTPYTRIHFCGNGGFYQSGCKRILDEDKLIHCNTRAFNYPGVTQRNDARSIHDLVNAGIAQVFNLAVLNNWSNSDIEKYIHLYGRSLGGAIALQVALHFKERFNVELAVVVDRSFSSMKAVIAERLNRMAGLPVGFGKFFANIILFAAGRWNIDSLAAMKKLSPHKIYYFNVAKQKSDGSRTFLARMKTILGIGIPEPDADRDIPNGSTFADGVKQAAIQGCQGFKVYAQGEGEDSHYIELSKLSTSPYEFHSALDCYAAIFGYPAKQTLTT